MASNPYQPTQLNPHSVSAQRSVFRYLLVSALLAVVGGTVAIPGLYLLNQRFGWLPTNSSVTGIELAGVAISNEAVVLLSLGIGLSACAAAICLFLLAMINWCGNRSTRQFQK